MLLEVKNLTAYRDSIPIVRSVSFHVNEGESVAILGANGAGKTTLIESIIGIISEKTGEVRFKGKDITRLNSEEIVKRGISLVPQGREIFSTLSVKDNLLLGAYTRFGRESMASIKETLEEVYGLFPILKEREKQLAGTLSGGEQQMLAIGRALMAKPTLLLLDEPSLGLAPQIRAKIFSSLEELHKKGITLLLVEQNTFYALRITERAYVMETGRLVMEGKSEEIAKDPEVIRAYLGREYREKWER
ncbi:ABC transporter ATP-binding protein [Candidatus Calescamantes bacterium]|nr:ABC transporter ATP-binding protein [Candidatus Calescamantes bacterium]